MKKFDIENFDPNDSHSINISVYKPDGILSFWNWFTRRNKNDGQRKNIKFKINKEDLDKMKLSGFDFQKLQTINAGDKNKSTRQCNVFTIPKSDLDPFLIKSLHPSMNTKTYVKRLVSKSTISIRSKESCANLKYVRTVRSQKSVGNSVQSSKTSFKVSMRSNANNSNLYSNQKPRNVFLKSVPTTILKSNTKKLLVLGKMKSPKANRTARNDPPTKLNSHQLAKENSNVIPMLLTRMKSMEEHLSDIENTTKKINDAVSQRNVLKVNSRNDLNSTERNKQKAIKCVASHKIYSKNVHAPRKSKKNRVKKLKNKSNTNILPANETPLKCKLLNKGFAFNYFSDSSNEFKKTNDLGNRDINYNKPALFFNQHGFTLPSNISKVEISPGNVSNVGCDLIMSVVKALTETKGSTNLQQMDNSVPQNKAYCPNIGSEVGVIDLGRSNCMSKSTFDWKHTRASESSEPQISETDKTNQENIKVKKNISVIFGNPDASHDHCDRNDILNQMFNPNLQKQIVMELLKSNNTQSFPVQDGMKVVGDEQTRQMVKQSQATEFPSPDAEVTEYKQRDDNNNNSEMVFQEKASAQACLYKQNSDHSTKVSESYKDTNEPNLEQAETDIRLEENSTLTDIAEFSEMKPHAEKRPLSLKSCEENNSEVTIGQGALCSVSIKQNAVSAAFTNSPEKQFKRTTISCSSAKKEPKVSITILVQDSMKGDVEMKSKLLKNSAISKEERFDKPLREQYSPPLSSFGPRGDHLSTACKTASLCSVDNFSSVSCVGADKKVKEPVPKITVENNSNSRRNKNFYVEVEDEGRQTFPDEDLNLGSPGTYLNHEKRKVLEEKVLFFKQNRSTVQNAYEKKPLSPIRSHSNISNGLASFDHLIETSFIRQETSYSKTKFNISKENKYNSRTALKPSESCKRCPFSDESLSTENKFDISTKYTSQQCVMYCRNNNVANFRRPKYPIFQVHSVENIDIEKRKQPFIVVHTPNNSRDVAVVNTDTTSPKGIQKGIGLNLREDPILEVSEDESVVENIVLNEQKCDENSVNEIKRGHEGLRNNFEQNKSTYSGIDKMIMVDTDKSNGKDNKVSSVDQAQNVDVVATEADVKCENMTGPKYDCGPSHSESKDVGLTTKEPRSKRGTTLTSRVSQTILSSTLVQTDWSLVGITVDHLNCSNNKCESVDCKKRTVASQTDVVMDQIASMNQDLEGMHSNCCKSCINSCQFSELVACNVTVPCGTNSPEVTKSVPGNQQIVSFSGNQDTKEIETSGVSVLDIKDKDLNSLECSTSSVPVKEDTLRSNLLEKEQTLTLQSCSRKLSSKRKPASKYCENKSEEILRTLKKAVPHICTIPCLTTLSDETVMSNMSESSYKVTARSIPDYHTVPQIHAINRGICSYYDCSDEKRAAGHLSPIEESRPSTSDSSAFCRVIGDGLDVDDGEFSKDENTESQTSLVEPEVKDAILDRMNTECLDSPDNKHEDGSEQVNEKTKLETASQTKKGNENTKVQGRKTSFKNCAPSKLTKREYSSIEKCTDYMINYLSIEHCDEEKKGNSVFSLQT